MAYLRRLICSLGGHNLRATTGPFPARCSFCDAWFADLDDGHGGAAAADGAPLPARSGTDLLADELDDRARP